MKTEDKAFDRVAGGYACLDRTRAVGALSRVKAQFIILSVFLAIARWMPRTQTFI